MSTDLDARVAELENQVAELKGILLAVGRWSAVGVTIGNEDDVAFDALVSHLREALFGAPDGEPPAGSREVYERLRAQGREAVSHLPDPQQD